MIWTGDTWITDDEAKSQILKARPVARIRKGVTHYAAPRKATRKGTKPSLKRESQSRADIERNHTGISTREQQRSQFFTQSYNQPPTLADRGIT